MTVYAILTRFRHHKPDGGYKRLLTELSKFPSMVIHEFGNDETDEKFPVSRWDTLQSSYKWIAEWRAWRLSTKNRPELLHVMYGEEYYRFGHRLFRKIPIVATFHQPADVLKRELERGDHGGRIAKWTHHLNRNRFEALAAAIVTNPDQKEVLKQHMPAERIHVIPLGVDLPEKKIIQSPYRQGILTLGNWFRDWKTYVKVVEGMPDESFHLVNRQLPDKIAQQLERLPNCLYHPNISDTKLQALIQQCHCAFLPLQKLAGSNALLECLAGGLPIVMSDVNAAMWKEKSTDCVVLFEPDDINGAIQMLSTKKRSTTLAHRLDCVEIARMFSWESIAQKTHDLYKTLT